MIGRTSWDKIAISKMTKKKLETIYKGRPDRLKKALEIWNEANPKKVEKEKEEK